ncbi:Mediator complex subunit 15, KIX domain [Dillenia turbinata]|uniref:Mediator complex subunit 15, KIX domain n=1 Tax=Dillenia turbinata TaxID=194707 RepID=A0AAN8YX19_9MAGN
MDGNNNWRPAPGQQAEQPVMDGCPGGDWRSQLQPGYRQRIVNEMYSDYLRKISLKMLTMESKSQTTMGNALPPNQVPNEGPQEPGNNRFF